MTQLADREARTANIGFAAMLADEHILIFLFAISSSPGSTFNVQLFVVNFNFIFSIGLRFRAGHYKIPAQQQAQNRCLPYLTKLVFRQMQIEMIHYFHSPSRHLFIFVYLLFNFSAHSQSPCDYIKSYSLAACNRDTAKALSDLEKFRDLFPTDSLIEEVNLAVAEMYYGKGELEKSKRIATEIIKKEIAEPMGGFNECPFIYESTDCRRQIFIVSDFKELQYKACMNLYAVYSLQRKYDSALYFLKMAESDFSCPSYRPSDCHKNLLLKYSTVFENMNDFDQAIDVLAPFILSDQITDRLLFLLKRYRNFDSIKEAYQNIEDSITIEYGVISESPKVKYEQDEYGRILRTISIEEYGRIAYWHFLGQKFAISGANDYKSHRVNGERKKRKLEAVKTDKQIIQEAKDWIQKYTIYKVIYN